jgi:hypothetical protein
VLLGGENTTEATRNGLKEQRSEQSMKRKTTQNKMICARHTSSKTTS